MNLQEQKLATGFVDWLAALLDSNCIASALGVGHNGGSMLASGSMKAEQIDGPNCFLVLCLGAAHWQAARRCES